MVKFNGPRPSGVKPINHHLLLELIKNTCVINASKYQWRKTVTITSTHPKSRGRQAVRTVRFNYVILTSQLGATETGRD